MRRKFLIFLVITQLLVISIFPITNAKRIEIKSIVNEDENYEYIIITNEDLKNAQTNYTFQDLINSKKDKGLTAKIFTVEEITNNPDYSVNGKWGDANPNNPFYETEITKNIDLFDDTAAKIRNFIRYAYTELGTIYVLLAGDADKIKTEDNIIPVRGLFADEDGLPLSQSSLILEEDDIPSDIYYACLDGNYNYDCDNHFGEAPKYNDINDLDEADLTAEVYVGRACVDSEEEVSNFVKKTITYDQSAEEYLSEILFVGESLGTWFYTPWGGDYKDQIQKHVSPEYNISKFYDRDHPANYWRPEELRNLLNTKTPHIINHDGHGNKDLILKSHGTYFSKQYLKNNNSFFIYSHSCYTGAFDNLDCHSGYEETDCIAEILTVENPYGAFACILNARYGLGSEDTIESPSGLYDESFYKALFVENIKKLGPANHYSKEYYIDRIEENGMRWCYYQTNLFGDPEISIKVPNNYPETPEINGPKIGKTGTNQNYNISLNDPNNDKIIKIEIQFGEEIITINAPDDGWESGSIKTFNYSYNKKGIYQIKARIQDEHGAWSQYSNHKIIIPKTKIFNLNIIKILQENPIINYLIKLLFIK